jgi:hypothetical protein
MASINSYNGSFGSILAKIEAAEGTAETPTAASNTIPVFQATPTIDLGFSMENPALEDMSGTKYLGQVTVAKCSWSMEMPIYGDGVSGGAVNIPRYVSQILATAFEVDTSPTSQIDLRPLITTATNNANCSFTLVGYFGLKGAPAGGAKLKALIAGCKIGKATFTLKSDGLHRLKLEGLGVYNSNWSDSTDNLSGNNWDSAANQFIRGTGQGLTLGGIDANVTSTEISIDFGADYILTDSALNAVGVGGIGYTKRDITFTIDPIWAPTSSYNIYSTALAGGSFAIASATAYPAAFSATAGYGFKVAAPFVQFAGSTPDRGVAVRQKLSGMAVKSVENTDPLTLTII